MLWCQGLTSIQKLLQLFIQPQQGNGKSLHFQRGHILPYKGPVNPDALLSQHIGAPAVAAVSVGDTVSEGDVVAKAAQGLSVNIHAPVPGRVLEVSDRYLVIGPQEAARG